MLWLIMAIVIYKVEFAPIWKVLPDSMGYKGQDSVGAVSRAAAAGVATVGSIRRREQPKSSRGCI
ncbi:hypothetical protein CG51_18050 [Haematobacter missouriensis]|uniref:Uncharacterized protein n=1 Tax=Haematobacter missouriensis TaxID=366616 RepID=A0A212AKJ6_9RHOB|nr:hypothetical protein CG51_18050 [Haematobacter missouriensis]OWJ73587.1 hypothetical protein CDV53_15300 [Haematobacter missouriensis]OWJ81992.1 hypothetical protein CDV52_16190 [Haematobacter missouriensis]